MRGRKRVAVMLVAVAAVLAIGATLRSTLSSEISPVGVGSKAPQFAAKTVDGSAMEKTLDDYRGSVLLLNIWATWCLPCRVEMPAIEKLHQAYGPKGLKVIAVSVDDPGMEQQIRSFVKEYGLTFEVLHDSEGQLGNVSRAFQTSGYPETVIVGRDGLIRKKILGAHDWNSAENRALIEHLLGQKAE